VDSFFARFRNPLTLLAIVLVQVIALASQVQHPTGMGAGHTEGHKVTLLRHWAIDIVTPFELASHGTSARVRSIWSNYLDLRHTRTRNQQLQAEITRLRVEQAEFAEDARAGRRLESMLQFQHSYVTQTVAAQVIGGSGSDAARMLTLNKGYDDGIRQDQPVLTPDGVVGKIRDVQHHTAQLLLLSDPTSGAGVVLASTRIRAIVRGTASGGVQINNLTADSRIKPGEQVLTSGGDGVYPRGLPVGVIEKIEPDPRHQPYTAITVHTNANLFRLEEVLVVTGTQPALTGQGEADASQAEAAAEANKRAADMVAERLPSAHDDSDKTTPQDGTDATGSPTVTLPKPKPVTHPDRYSPGSEPPATDLTPGGSH
jgi:rod shape-determining protein MreC